MNTCVNSKLIGFTKGIKFFFVISLILLFSFNISSVNSIADSPDVTLKIHKIIIPEDVIEGYDIIIGVIIKNKGSENILPGNNISDKLYIDSGTNLVFKNWTLKGLSAGASIYLNLSWIAEVGEHTLIVKLFHQGEGVDRQDVPIKVDERKVDLKLNSVYFPEDLLLDQPVNIFANATNLGKNFSGNIEASLSIDGKHEQSKTIEELLRGETYNFSFEWIPKHFDYHIINVTLDPKNKIKEEDETNNFFECERFIEPYRVEWKSTSWHYRKFYSLKGTGNISVSINFTMLLNQMGVYGKTFENDSIMIVKYSTTGDIESIVTTFNFQESVNFDNKTDASGDLLWEVNKKLTYFCIYFDVVENNIARKKLDETVGMTEFGDAEINFEKPVEGWWPEFIPPNYDYYPLHIEISIKIISTAEASNVIAYLYRNGKNHSTITLETNDHINWIKKHTFSNKGTWMIKIWAKDIAGFKSDLVQTENFSVTAVPDLSVEKIVLPAKDIIEGERASIQVIFNNTGYADAKNYTIGLYLAQDRITWSDNQVENTTNISIEKDESKEIILTWYPAIYGRSSKKGKWIVGAWIYTDSSHRDSNTENNRETNYSLNVIPGEKSSPIIKITELTNRQEKGKTVQILAEVTDESGIKSVNLTIINPVKKKYFEYKTQQQEDTYKFEFSNTSITGEYDFSIIAIDNSFYKLTSKYEGKFVIIEDATPPTINYYGAYPPVQLKDGYVNISCISTDFTGINEIRVIIIYPDNYTLIKSMKLSTTEGKYEYSQTYDIVGKYVFYITSEDKLGNKRSTENKVFWITTNIDDTDDDGMPDWWEKRYGFDPYDPTDSKQDEDRDGYTNIEEYKSGYNPLKHLSSMQEIVYKFRENWSYLIISIILFILIIVLSIYGLKRQKNGSS
jgi:hypothetical protein